MRGVLVFLVLVASAPASGRKHKTPWVPALPGSYESMVRQNNEIDQLLLPRIADELQLEALEATGELVEIQPTYSLMINPGLQKNRRFCRPWTRQLLYDISADYYQRFKLPLIVTSAVRTSEQQRALRRRNGNAAPEQGDITSSHLAGITVDIGRRGMTKTQREWTEAYLKNLRDKGMVEVAEERRQLCFHVMVSNKYGVE
jgi:hypothetical protein